MSDMVSNSETSGDDLASQETQRQRQFGLNALFWTIGTLGLTLAYLRRFDSPTIYPNFVAVAVAACLIVQWAVDSGSHFANWHTLDCHFGIARD